MINLLKRFVGMALLVSASAFAQEWQPVISPAAQQLDITASGSGYRYRLFMSVPKGPVPVGGYPVMYVLDGNAAFPVAAFLSRIEKNRSDVTGYVAPLIVGIGYPGDADFDVAARRRDYTPPDGKGVAATQGGADVFLDFIEREVKPLVASRYPVDVSRQALFGHSFGGLLVVHALLNRPTSFSTFIASSPSIWWDDESVLHALPKLKALELDPARIPRVQITAGTLEDDRPKGKYSPEVLATLSKRSIIPGARNLASALRAMPGWRERVVHQELVGENHGTVWFPAMSRGITFFLEQPDIARH